jgi:L-ascorbate metabolism protein UlaG (beta-lactamase superfamily)
VAVRGWRLLRRVGGALGTLLIVLVLVVLATTQGLRTFGGTPSPERWAREQKSPHFKDGKFVNVEETNLMSFGKSGPVTWEYLFGKEMRAPSCELLTVHDAPKVWGAAPESGLRITWFGHSSTLIEIDGAVIATDPMFSERASPSSIAGPKRFHEPPVSLDQLPKLDAVVVSHEHYDHLDMASIERLARRGVQFFVPLGIGAHLDAWGIPAAQIHELDWWEEGMLPGGVRLVSTPARHFNGRGLPWRPGSSWTSWSMVGPSHRVFFSGDTGQTEAFHEIAEKVGPFDVAMLEIGQFHESWGTIHLGPMGALEAASRLKAKRLFPIHWSTFVLGLHAWNEPPETLTVEAEKRGQQVVTPRLGEPVEPMLDAKSEAWWRAYPPIAAQCPEGSKPR